MMHREYRILNIVLSKDSLGNPKVLSDIAVFKVDKENGINEFVEVLKQVKSLYPYTQEMLVHKTADVVILDDIKFNGKLKTLLLKNKHMIMSLIDYQYKESVYVICKVDTDSYLVYLGNGKQEIVTYSDLAIYDNMGKLFNAKLVESSNRGKTVYKVVCGVNSNTDKKYNIEVETRNLKDVDKYYDNKGRFALDVVNLRKNSAVKDVIITNGHLDSLIVETSDDAIDFVLPITLGDLLNVGRHYQFLGNFNNLDLSSVRALNKNAILLKGFIDTFKISSEMALSSNLDFLIYSLREFTGQSDYFINNLVFEDDLTDADLDLAISLLAELYFNTDYAYAKYENFPIKHIIFDSPYTNAMKDGIVDNDYSSWINAGLTRFSVRLLENYNKALGYCKKVMMKSGRTMHDCSIQIMQLLSSYESELIEELDFFRLASLIFSDSQNEIDDSVYNEIIELITKNQEERTNSTDDVQELVNELIKKLK